MNQGHLNHLHYDLNSTEGAGKESSLSGLKTSGSPVSQEGLLPATCDSSERNQGSGLTQASPRLISSFASVGEEWNAQWFHIDSSLAKYKIKKDKILQFIFISMVSSFPAPLLFSSFVISVLNPYGVYGFQFKQQISTAQNSSNSTAL